MHSKEWQKKLPQYYLNTSKIKHFFSKEETLQNSFLKHIWFSDNFNGNKSQIISFSSLMWVHTNHDSSTSNLHKSCYVRNIIGGWKYLLSLQMFMEKFFMQVWKCLWIPQKKFKFNFHKILKWLLLWDV